MPHSDSPRSLTERFFLVHSSLHTGMYSSKGHTWRTCCQLVPAIILLIALDYRDKWFPVPVSFLGFPERPIPCHCAARHHNAGRRGNSIFTLYLFTKIPWGIFAKWMQ